ncbi:MAG: DUF885 domain-containing protein, partial [Proteobacteria bacterium]|nr:DUF885 domain-containing protein [Pseudomonadota bacterium]
MKLLPMMICAALAGTAAAATPALADPAVHAAPAADVATRVKALNALLAEQWQHTMESAPEFATMLGDLRYNDRWSDMSLEHLAAEQKVKAD